LPTGVLKNIRRAAPREIGGRTIGISSKVSIQFFPVKSILDSMYAVGTEIIVQKITAIVAVRRVSLIENDISSDNIVDTKVCKSVYHAIEIKIPKKKSTKNPVEIATKRMKSRSEKAFKLNSH